MADVYGQKPWLKSYDKHVPANLQYPDKPFWEAIEPAFKGFPNRVGLYYMGTPFTFKQLDEMSNRFANLLKKIGLKRGDTIGINLPNLPAYYIGLVGIQKVGCVLTGVSPLLTADELNHQLKDCGAKVLVTLDALYPRIIKSIGGTELKAIVFTGIADYLSPLLATMGKMLKKIPTGKVLPIPGIEIYDFKQVMKSMPADPVSEKVSMDDTCVMQYTGGTTGLPKGAELTHRNMTSQMFQINTWLDAPMGKLVGMTAFPLFHIAGLVICMALFAKANTQVAVPNPRDQQFLIKAMKKHRPNIIGNVPTVYLELIKQPGFIAYDFSKVQYFASGAAPFPPEYIKDFEKIVGENKLVEVYGLTETSPIITANPRYGKKIPGAVGIAFPDTDIKIIDPATGEPVPFNEPGEIAVRGPQVFTKGYFRKPEETANALRNGWFYTGDVGKMDEDGFVTIVDRIKDMVNVSGFKVFTRELDDVICEHPDVDMCATVGIQNPDRPGTEMVASAIILKPGIEKSDAEKARITEYLKGKVAPYKVPKTIEFFDQLPTSAVGKILKREIRTILSGKVK
ncbi:MAG: AMP-binding protein [Chloroflexi bacterium]|nr:AMP-binding protein [Chloroflexota bacterium]